MAGKLLCFGDLCVDVVGKTKSSANGSDVTLDELSIRPAGAAVNCAVAAGAQGVEVEMMGVAGDDLFAELVLTHLTNAKVGTQYVRRMSGRTGTVISIVDSKAQTRLYSYRGVNAMSYPMPVMTADCIYLSGYSFQDSESRLTAQSLLHSGIRCALDPSFQYARDFQAQSLNIEFLLPNLEEARLMTKLNSPEECAAALLQLGIATVVIKLGSGGCYVHSNGLAEYLSVPPVTAIDTTGAGDAFTGTFLASILQDNSIVQSASRANDVAHKLVSRKR